jgi:hypothetical protein
MLVQTVSSFRRARKSQFVIVLVLLLVIDPFSITMASTSTRKRPGCSRNPAFLNYYPANAVKADIPFPFGNGRITAAWSSDFQLRHVMFPMQPSLLVNEISVRESHL